VKNGAEKKRLFKEHVIDNRWMNIAPLSHERMSLWRHDNAAVLRRDAVSGVPIGISQVEQGIRALPGIEGVCNMVPEFELLARPYQDLLNHKFNYKYFGGFVDAALSTGHYEKNKNLQALPYDFRRVLDPHYREELFYDMKRAVESQGRPVVIVGHSLGAVLFKWFLTEKVDERWAERHVRRFFVVNAPFGGSNTALKAVMSGEYFVPIFSKKFHSSLQLNGGIIMCFPNSYGYLPHEPLAIVGGDVGDVRDVITSDVIAERGLSGGGGPEAPEAFEAWRALYHPHMDTIMDPIRVPTHVVTCAPVLDTLKMFRMREVAGGDVAAAEETAHEPGDGQVSARSLGVAFSLFDASCMMQTTIDGCHHINIVGDPRFARLVLDDALDALDALGGA